MAIRPFERMHTSVRGVQIIRWSGLRLGDEGEPFECPFWAGKTVQVYGTFGTGGTVVVEGTLDVGLTPVYAILTDPQGNAISKTAASIETVAENVYKIRPRITGGTASTDLTVVLLVASKTFIS